MMILNDGGHATGQQPYFNIAMVDSGGNPISCAAYEVDAMHQTIVGFNSIQVLQLLKPWTSVFLLRIMWANRL